MSGFICRRQPIVVPVVAEPSRRAEGDRSAVGHPHDADRAVDPPTAGVRNLHVGDVPPAVRPPPARVLADPLPRQRDDLAVGAVGQRGVELPDGQALAGVPAEPLAVGREGRMAFAFTNRVIGQLADLAAGGREEIDRVLAAQVVADLEDEPLSVGREIDNVHFSGHRGGPGLLAGLDVW